MAFKVHVGPPQITVHQGQTVLVSELDGRIEWPSDKGLYFRDTRMISSWAIYANDDQQIGQSWVARGFGHHQQQHEARTVSARDCYSMRLRRHLRGEIRPDRPS